MNAEILGGGMKDVVFCKPLAAGRGICQFLQNNNGTLEAGVDVFPMFFMLRPGTWRYPYGVTRFFLSAAASAPGPDGVAFPTLFPELLFVGFDLVRLGGTDR